MQNCKRALTSLSTQRVVTRSELNLKYTLLNGQAFNWFELHKDTPQSVFRGIFENFVVTFSYDEQERVMFEQWPEAPDLTPKLNDYFQLNIDMQQLCAQWSQCDAHFALVYAQLRGLRILRQDPFECLISFLCSQNNNIPRITQILARIREKHGQPIDTKIDDVQYYQFPTLQALAAVSEQEFRTLGLGYRAAYLQATLQKLQTSGGHQFLHTLRTRPYEEVKQTLLEFMGIGSKVADCICLFSLDQTECIPVDTHVYQIYHRVYKNKELKINAQNYTRIGDFFRTRFVKYAGWAHSYLFTADLSSFKIVTESVAKSKSAKSSSVQSEDDEFDIDQSSTAARSQKSQKSDSTGKRGGKKLKKSEMDIEIQKK